MRQVIRVFLLCLITAGIASGEPRAEAPFDMGAFKAQIESRTLDRTVTPFAFDVTPKLGAPVPDNRWWSRDYGHPAPGAPGGVNGRVFALHEYRSAMVAAGDFTTAGLLTTNRIAKWNGIEWAALASGVGGTVFSLEEYNDKLFVGGWFLDAGNAQVQHLAAWSGSIWEPFSAYANGPVYALQEHDGLLYVGGSFTWIGGRNTPYLACWNGNSWEAPPFSPPSGPVDALESFQGNLIAGGRFESVDGLGAGNVASWDGSQWSALGIGMNDFVWALEESAGNLYAGGRFTTAGGVSASRIARWNGTVWSSLSSGVDGEVFALTNAPQGLWICGEFSQAGGDSVSGLGLWQGNSAWGTPFNLGVPGPVFAAGHFDGETFFGGDFPPPPNTNDASMVRWAGLPWNRLGPAPGLGANGRIRSMTVHDGNLVVSGDFDKIGDLDVDGLATIRDGAWVSLDAPTSGGADVRGWDGRLYFGSHVWDGRNWLPLLGTDGPPDLELSGIAYRSYSGQLQEYAGSWVNVAPLLSATINGIGSFGQQIVVSAQSGSGRGVYGWDGTQWVSYNTNIERCLTLAAHDGEMVAMLEGPEIVRWNGATWDTIGILDPVYPTLQLDVIGGRIFAHRTENSSAVSIDGVPLIGVLEWTGSGWEPLGSGLDGSVDALLYLAGNLYIGGKFSRAGTWGSWNLAAWNLDQDPVSSPVPPRPALPVRAYPNPFNPSTSIVFELSKGERVTLDVFDVAGRRVERALDTYLEAGAHSIPWNADESLPSGVYIVRVTTGTDVGRARAVLLK